MNVEAPVMGNRGKDLENEALKSVKADMRATGGRYGVMAYVVDGEWKPKKSLPDLEGVFFKNGRQWISEAKTVSGPSLGLSSRLKNDNSWKQLEHLFDRSQYRANTSYLIHFNERELAKRTEPNQTWLFPVHPFHPYWRGFLQGRYTTIKRDDCEKYGVRVNWGIPNRCRRPRMQIVDGLFAVDEILEDFRTNELSDWRLSELFQASKQKSLETAKPPF